VSSYTHTRIMLSTSSRLARLIRSKGRRCTNIGSGETRTKNVFQLKKYSTSGGNAGAPKQIKSGVRILK